MTAVAYFSPDGREVVSAASYRAIQQGLAAANAIIEATLRKLPVGYIPNHTRENLPEMVDDMVKMVAEESFENRKLIDSLKALLPIAEATVLRLPGYDEAIAEAKELTK